MTLPLPEHDGRISGKALQTLLNIADTSNALAVGPGLGRSRSLDRMVSRLYRKADCPSVFDADALHALAQSPRKLAYAPADGNKQRIITPHMGEFRRLVDQPDLQRPAAIDLAREIAKRYRIVVVLKGAGTVVCSETDQFVNTTGNPGLATGGTGDVLTGILCGLLAQKLPAFQAAVAGVYLHGLAADLAVKDLGETAMIASDLLAYLPQAIQRYTQTTIQPNHLHPPNQQPRKSP